MVTDDTGLSSDGAQTVSDDCTSFPALHPSLSLWGEPQHKGRPRCPLAALERHLLTETAVLPLLFHLAVAPSISIYGDLSRWPPSPSLSVTHSAEGVQRSDNEIMTQPFQPFKSRPFLSLCPLLSFLILPLLIFSYSHVLVYLISQIAASITLKNGCKSRPRDELGRQTIPGFSL